MERLSAVLSQSSFSICTFQYLLLLPSVEETVALPRETMHFSILDGIEVPPELVFELSIVYAKAEVPVFSCARTICTAHSVWAGMFTFWDKIFSISRRWSSRTVGWARYGAEWAGFNLVTVWSCAWWRWFIPDVHPIWRRSGCASRCAFFNVLNIVQRY